jgi:hypothetical protein
MECKPTQAGNRQIESFCEIGRSCEDWKLEPLQFFDIGAAIGQTAGNATAEKENIGELSAGNIFGVLAFSFGGLGFFTFFELLAFFGVLLNGRVSD